MRSLDPEFAVRVFVSSVDDEDTRTLRGRMEDLANRSFNPPLSDRGVRIDVRRWEQNTPGRAVGGANARNVQRAAGSHVVCGLLFDRIGSGTADEIRAAIESNSDDAPEVSIFLFEKPGEPRSQDVADFLEKYQDDVEWSRRIDPQSDDCWYELTKFLTKVTLDSLDRHQRDSQGGYRDEY